MKIAYVSSNVMDVQKHLIDGLNVNNINAVLFSYSMRRNSYRYDKLSSSVFFECNSIFRGPLFYMSRLNLITNHFLKQEQLNNVDVLHGNMMSDDGYICRQISKIRKIPYIVSVRNTDIHLWFLWKLPWLKKMCYQNLLGAKKIVFLNKPYMDKLFSYFSKKQVEKIATKCIVIPNGIDDYWFDNIYGEKRQLNNSIRLITAGRIEKNKNQLITAAAIELAAKKENLNLEYIIVGDCKDLKMVEKLSIYNFVKIKPFQTKEKLITELRKSDIYIMPSHTETFGLTYVEAMTQGLPLIYSKGQGFDGQFIDGLVGYSVDSNSVKEISNGIIAIIKKYDILSHNAVEKCVRFKWLYIIEALKKVYLESL